MGAWANESSFGTEARRVVTSPQKRRSCGLGRTRSEVSIAEMGIAGAYLLGEFTPVMQGALRGKIEPSSDKKKVSRLL
mgnify:CR=1 FL=1